MSFPWLRNPWLRIVESAQQQRLAHAYYMRHAPQQGSEQFLSTLANYLLCQQPGNRACGQCKACKLYNAGNHPDFWQIDAADESSIGIDDVRKLQAKLVQTANQGGARVAIIRPADKLTEQASNAILKVLEEPPAGMFWLLAVAQPEQLLPTLRSRMQWLNLELPETTQYDDNESATTLLRMLFDGALAPVIKDKEQALQWLDISEYVLQDLYACLQGIANSRFHYPDLYSHYRGLLDTHRIQATKLQHAVDECRQLRQRFRQSRGLNITLLLNLHWQQWAAHGFAASSQT